MGNISTDAINNNQSEDTIGYYHIIDILAATHESKLEFFIGEESVQLNTDEFNLYNTEDRRFKVDYSTDGTVRIYLQLATDEVINDTRDSVGKIIIKA